MSKKNMQLFVSSVETFRDDGTRESKTEYNLDGKMTHVFTYDEQGHPLPHASLSESFDNRLEAPGAFDDDFIPAIHSKED